MEATAEIKIIVFLQAFHHTQDDVEKNAKYSTEEID